jgi:hypothetical protein
MMIYLYMYIHKPCHNLGAGGMITNQIEASTCITRLIIYSSLHWNLEGGRPDGGELELGS